MNEAVFLADAFVYCSNMLRQHGCAAYTKSKNILDFIRSSLGNAADVTHVQGHKHAGYMLTRRGASLSQALFNSLAAARKIEIGQAQVLPSPTNLHRIYNEEVLHQLVASRMCKEVNELTDKWKKRSKHARTPATLDVEECIGMIPVDLWQHMWCMLCPQSAHGNVDTHSSRRLPCLYMIASLCHQQYRQCTFLFHLILADFVQSQCGSADLLSVLCRLSISSNWDSIASFKVGVISQRIQHSIAAEIPLEAFGITSIDNIDRNAPGKWIGVGIERGFYGTSIQHVSPRPLSSLSAPCCTSGNSTSTRDFSKAMLKDLSPGQRTFRHVAVEASERHLQ